MLDFKSLNLYDLLLGKNWPEDIEKLVLELHAQGHSKREIYECLMEFFKDVINIDPRTRDNEKYYDMVADFLDRFTAWGKHFRILPEEPDCD